MRWIVFFVFVISSTLNYLDRQLLATLAPLIMAEFKFDQTGFGFLISAFSVAYAASSLLAGRFLDRVGVNRGISASVSCWSVAAVATGLTHGLGGLTICRAVLGVGESAGVPAAGKVNGMYLKPEERALGTAVNQVGLSLGLVIAPLFISMARAHTWRAPFVITGLFGFLWIPLWRAVSRVFPPGDHSREFSSKRRESRPGFSLLLDRPLILIVLANVLWMGSYSLWSNWTTLYLTRVHHITLQQSASYIWLPPFISNFGGFFGGWLSLRWVRHGAEPVAARRKAIWVAALGSLTTLLLPFAPDAHWATTIISISFFFALAGSVNIYAIPIDLYGAARSGLAISALTCAYGLLQTVISPLIGYLSDHRLYTQVVWIVTLPPILAAIVLMYVQRKASEVDDALKPR